MIFNSKNFQKTKTIIIFSLILILAVPALLLSVPEVKAANYDTYAFLALSTNPIGVNQNEIVVFWLSLPPPTAA